MMPTEQWPRTKGTQGHSGRPPLANSIALAARVSWHPSGSGNRFADVQRVHSLDTAARSLHLRRREAVGLVTGAYSGAPVGAPYRTGSPHISQHQQSIGAGTCASITHRKERV